MIDLELLDFSKGNGLVTVVAQDVTTGCVLMLAHADREALERTIATGEMHYRSRTRGLWHKGASSGNRQHVVSLEADCDGDAILARVHAEGPACHTGAYSCFGHGYPPSDVLVELDATIQSRAERTPDQESYTARLLQDRNLRLKKIGEEAAEFVTACADGDCGRASEEAADLFFHALVALHAVGGSLAEIQAVLTSRRGARTRSF